MQVFPGQTTVGQTASQTVTVTMKSSGTASSFVAVTAGTAATKEFTAAAGSCQIGQSYSAGQQCTLNVGFQPVYPGLRAGAVEVRDSGGNVLGQALVSAIGYGSLAVITPGTINTVAGDTLWFYVKDGVVATQASIFLPYGIVTDSAGNLYISDTSNNRIRRVDAQSRLISTVAGTATGGYNGDNMPSSLAQVNAPAGITLDGAGNIYFADSGNNVVRRIDARTGIITTVAGTPGVQGYSGDNAAATAAKLTLPEGIAFDASGNLYIADTGNNVVRRVDATTGTITTVAGTGVAGYNGDSQAAASAQLSSPWGIAVSANGSIFIADWGNNLVREVLSSNGQIKTVAGTGTQGFTGDGTAAVGADLNNPQAVALDPAGNLYIADSGNNRVRVVDPNSGNIRTIAGDGSEDFPGGDGSPATQAGMYGPIGLYFDQAGNLFIADTLHNRIREVSATTMALTFPTMKVGKLSTPPTKVNVDNDGNATLKFVAPQLDQSALDPVTTSCKVGTPLATSGECTLGVEFAPIKVGSPINGSLTERSDAGNSPLVLTLTGTVLSVEPTTTTLTSGLNPSPFGTAVTFTATVAAADAVTGTVSFLDGSVSLCADVPLTAANTATCTVSTLALGNHNIVANYSGDAANNDSTANLTQVVKQQPAVVLQVGPPGAIGGGNVTLTATITATTGVPTGTITFFDGTTQVGTANINASGVATMTTNTLGGGDHVLTAQYDGDTNNFTATSNTVNFHITFADTITTISTSNASVGVGTPVTLTSVVTSSNGPVPTGTVNFMDGAATVGTGTLAAGTTTLTVSTLAPGVHHIVAQYVGDANDGGSSSSPLVETINQIPTVTMVSSSANPIHAGASVTLTANVSLGAGAIANGPITGTVTFTNGATVLGTAAVNGSGIAVISTTALDAGSQPIVASYSGNTNYGQSASSALTEVVQQTNTTTTVMASAANSTAGQSVTFTATVVSGTATPGGTVNFTLGGSLLGSGTLNASGVATFTTTNLPVGTDNVLAVYVGNIDYTTSQAQATVVVAQASTTTALTSSANPQAVGQPVTLTATVTSSDPGATGTVNFLDGATALGSATVTNGVATLNTSTLAFGSHSITAVYSGDVDRTGSTSAALNQLIVQPAMAVLTSSANPSVSGQNITFTVKVTGPGSTLPTGKVTFFDGGNALGMATLDATGAATYATSSLIVGTHPISVKYAGDTNFSVATGVLTQTVGSASTNIALTASANPAIFGTPTTLTATINSNGSTATGTVTFTDGSTTLGSGTLNAGGVATLTTSTLTPGVHSIVANYAGDGNTAASVSTALSLTVEQMTQIALTSSVNPTYTLTPVTFTATVSNSSNTAPTGTVTFTDGSTQLGTASVGSNGVANLTVQSLPTGTHAVVASYGGDAVNFAAQSSTLSEVVNLQPTSTALTATQADPNDPQAVTLIAVVRWTAQGTTIPTGTVTFTTGTTTIGSVQVDATGVATLNVELQSAGESIVATYSGDTNYATSASLATTVKGGTATQFTLTLTPPNATVVTGQHTTVQINLASIKNFSDTLQLGCLGLPFAATCTFSPSDSVKLAANGTATVTLTIDTGNPLGSGAVKTSSVQQNDRSGIVLAFLPAGLLLGFGLFGPKRSRRKLTALMVLAFAAALTITSTGCSGLHVNSTPPGSYTFKVTASGTGTGATQSQVVNFTVTGQ